MQVSAKAALYVGLVLLLGAGVFVRWIARGRDEQGIVAATPRGGVDRRRPVGWGSALDVIDTISRSVGSFDPSLVLPYLSETNDGKAVLAEGGNRRAASLARAGASSTGRRGSRRLRHAGAGVVDDVQPRQSRGGAAGVPPGCRRSRPSHRGHRAGPERWCTGHGSSRGAFPG